VISRFFKIVAAASSLTLLYLAERRRGVPAGSSTLPARLRHTLDDLDVTFIKIGQALRMGPDLFQLHEAQSPSLRQRHRWATFSRGLH